MAPRKQRTIRRRKRRYIPPQKAKSNPQNPEKDVLDGKEDNSSQVSVSHRKLMAVFEADELEDSTSESESESSDSFEDGEATGTIFQDVELLAEAIKSLSCKECGGEVRLAEDLGAKKGLSRLLVVECEKCDFQHKLRGSKEIKTGKTTFAEVNRKAVLAMKSLGHSRAGLARFCAYMNIAPPMHKASYQDHFCIIRDATVAEAKKVMKEAACELRKLSQQVTDEVGDDCDGLVDVGVSCDGSWARRGFSSLFGLVAVISVDTGKILDYHILSKVCYSCRYWEGKDKNCTEYKEWKESHAGKCDINWDKSSPAMEAEGALKLWQRSVETHSLRYTMFIGDGDSKSHKNVKDAKPYGEGVEVEKKDCVGHVQKRMGAGLREVVNKRRGQKLADGKSIGGKGRLTKKRIDDFQTYYGKAIRNNLKDVDAMQRAILAILFHSASTASKPQHQYCLTGPKSWCRWQTDKTYQPKEPLPQAVFEVVLPTFERLSTRNLLDKCKEGFSQNQNESFHSTVWRRCPKEQFHGLVAVEAACADAVCHWNAGAHSAERILEAIGITPGQYAVSAFEEEDQTRLYAAEKSFSKEGKEARKKRRRKRKGLEDKQEQKEGVTYGAGAFGIENNGQTAEKKKRKRKN